MSNLSQLLAGMREAARFEHSPLGFDALSRIEAAARADHPEDWPPKDGDVRNADITVSVWGEKTLIYQRAYGGAWISEEMALGKDVALKALRQLASEGRL